MQKLRVSKQIIIFFIVAFFLALELFVFLPWSVGRVIKINKRVAKTFHDLKIVKKDWPNKDVYLNKKEELRKEIKGIRNKFISPQETSRLLSFISSTSRDFGVEIKSFSPHKIEECTSGKSGEFKYIPIEIKAKSKFHNLVLFLEHLHKSQYFFEVKDLRIVSERPRNTIQVTICGLIKEE